MQIFKKKNADFYAKSRKRGMFYGDKNVTKMQNILSRRIVSGKMDEAAGM